VVVGEILNRTYPIPGINPVSPNLASAVPSGRGIVAVAKIVSPDAGYMW